MTTLAAASPYRDFITNDVRALSISLHVLALAALVWIAAWRNRGGETSWPASPLREGALAVVLALFFLSWATAPPPAPSPTEWIVWAQAVLVFLVAARLFAAPSRGWLFPILAGGGALLAVVHVAETAVRLDLDPPLFFPFSLNRNHLAQLLLVPFFCALHELLGTGRRRRAWGGACGLVIAFGLLATRSRAAWVGLAVVVAIALASRLRLLLTRRLPRRTLVGLALLLPLGLVLALASSWLASQLGLPTVLDTVSTLANPLEGSAGGRLRRWANGLAMVADHPWLGVGPGNWGAFFPLYRGLVAPDTGQTSSAYNSYLGFAAETGLPALALLLVFLASFFRRAARPTRELRLLRLALGAWLVAAAFHMTLGLRTLQIALFFALGLVAGIEPGRRRLRIGGQAGLILATLNVAGFAVATGYSLFHFQANLHHHVVTEYVREHPDGTRTLELPGALGPAAGVVQEIFRAAWDPGAREQLASLASHSTGRPRPLALEMALGEVASGNCADAEFWLEHAVREAPHFPELSEARCRCALAEGRHESARELCAAGVEKHPREPWLRLLRAEAAAAGDDPEAARAAWEAGRRLLRDRVANQFGSLDLEPAQRQFAAWVQAGEQARRMRERLGLRRPPEALLEEIATTPQLHSNLTADGDHVYVSTTWTGRFDLWRVRLAGGAPELLTLNGLSPFRPRALESRRAVYFTSDDDGDYAYHLYRFDLATWEVRRLARSLRGVEREYELTPDGSGLVFKREHGVETDLYWIDPDGANERRLTDDGAFKRDLVWRPDSRHVAWVEDDERIVSVDLETGGREVLVERAGARLRAPAYDGSGRRLVYLAQEADRRARLVIVDLASGEERTLLEPGFFLSPRFLDDEQLLFREIVEDRYLLRILDLRTGLPKAIGPTEGVVYPVLPLPGPRPGLLYVHADPNTPHHVERLDLEEGRSVTLFRSDAIEPGEVVAPERVEWKGARTLLPAWVFRPPAETGGARHPVILWLHGGSSSFSPRWNLYAQYFAHAGYVFAALNFTGSSGLPLPDVSREELHRIRAEDVLSFVDEIATWPEVDAGRIAMVGVSDGNLTLQDVLRTRPGAFGAAVEYAPIPDADWEKIHEDLPPVLVFLGENDPSISQTRRIRQLERQSRAGTRVEHVVLAREGHDLRRPESVRRRLEETRRFLESGSGTPRRP